MASDLRLTFTKKNDTVYHVKCSVEGGDSATSTFILPMSTDDMSEVVGQLSATRSMATPVADTSADAAGRDGSRQTTRSSKVLVPPQQRQTAEDLGQKLFEQLFDADIKHLYEEVTSGGGARIRLVMDADNTTLMSIPWEFLCRNGMFLAAQRDTPILREFTTPNQPQPFVAPEVIKVLGVTASPTDLEPLDVAAEKQGVNDAITTFSDVIEVEWVDDCTYATLQEALNRVQPHILHFVGHSRSEDGVAAIALCNTDGTAKHHSATTFANLLGKAPDLRVVVLNSCEGARTGKDDPFTGLAARLIEQGRSAVVAMQFEITDDAACMFAEKFYTALVRDRLPIDQAVATARLAVMGVNEVEFATPVLFLASSETNDVFQFRPPVQLPPAAPLAPPPPQPFASDPSTTHLEPSAETTAPPSPTPSAHPDSNASTDSKRGIGRILIGAGAGAFAVIVAIIVVVLLVGESGPAYDCINSAAFENSDELPFGDDVFDKLDEGAQICSEAFDNFSFTGAEANEIVRDRIDRIDAALDDGEVTIDEYAQLVLDADGDYDTVYDSI